MFVQPRLADSGSRNSRIGFPGAHSCSCGNLQEKNRYSRLHGQTKTLELILGIMENKMETATIVCWGHLYIYIYI